MHIEPGVVDGAKLMLSVATAAGAFGIAGKMAWETIKKDGGVSALLSRSAIATVAVLTFFEVFPHYPVGVSEVHFILGSTLFLLFGGGAAAIGLALGLLAQAFFLEPIDLPQYGMNVTTLIVPLWAVSVMAKKIIAPGTAYVDLAYKDVLKLSAVFQAGVVAWVAFWVAYGQGLGAETLTSLATFGAAYMLVIVVEPIADLAVLWAAKTWKGMSQGPVFTQRLHQAA